VPGLVSAEGAWTSFISNITINKIAFEGDYIWCASDSGVIKFNKIDKSIIRYTTDDGLCGNVVIAVAIDYDGVKWFGTPNNGVSRYEGYAWTTYTNIDFIDGRLLAIGVDKNNIKWFGTWSYNSSTDVWEKPLAYWDYPGIAFDKNNVKWFAGGEIVRYDDAADSVTYYRTENGTMPETGDIFLSIAIDKNDIIWFGGMDDGARSFDGTNWVIYNKDTGVVADAPFEFICSIAVDKNNVKWFGTIWGIWSYNGIKWKYYNEDIDYPPVIYDVKIDNDGIIWLAGKDGLMTFTPPEGAGVKEKPDSFELLISTIPNPFNSSTTLSFSLPNPSSTALAVYSLTGQRVRTLVSGPLSAGAHSVVWDGRDDAGRTVSSGVYLSRLKSGGKAATEKMLLMK
jgi:hypothetical protein